MAHNLVWGAKALQGSPIDTDLKALDAEAELVSRWEHPSLNSRTR
jgi:hypothetical protein